MRYASSLTGRPDIFNATDGSLYEIKSVGEAGTALQDAQGYVNALRLAGVTNVHLGSSSAAGTSGEMQVGNEILVWVSTGAGQIIYEWIPVPGSETQPLPDAKPKLHPADAVDEEIMKDLKRSLDRVPIPSGFPRVPLPLLKPTPLVPA
jgi:hypothetical protein